MKEKIQNEFWTLLKLALLAGMFVFLLKGFILIPTTVEGSSMKDTLQQNDHIILEKFTRIKRFDVIVIRMPSGRGYVKRVIGLPGDHIRYENDQLYINGNPVAEPFLQENKQTKEPTDIYTTNFDLRDIIGRETLPKNHYFVLGDNRRFSKDSRSSSIGTIKSEYIIGKARFVYYPWKDFGFIH